MLEVDHGALDASRAFAELTRAVAASRFAPKVCWPLLDRRRHRLHATVAGALSDEDAARLTGPEGRAALGRLGPVAFDLRGLFNGRINRGRLYLKGYPEQRRGRPALAAVHEILGRPPADLFLVGLYNLVDELDVAEAEELHGLVGRWWDRSLVVVAASRLALMRAFDDLMLESEVVGSVALAAPA